MSIRPIDLNGMIQRTQDVSNVKLQEDNKPMIDQQNIQQEVAKETQKLLKQVQHADDSNQPEYRYDAKEKGKGQYQGNGNQKKKSEKDKTKDKVVVKNFAGSIDIKI